MDDARATGGAHLAGRTAMTMPRASTDGWARDMLDHLPFPVLSFDLTGADGQPRLRWCNAAIEGWLGRRSRDLRRSPELVWGHVHGDDLADLKRWFAAPTTQGTTLRVRWVTAGGRVVSSDVHAIARGGTRSAPAFADLVIQDASQEVALATAVATHRSQIAALVQRNDEVVFQLRVDPLTVGWVNDAAPKLLGIEPTALREDATRLFDAMSPSEAKRVREALQTALSGETRVRFCVRRATGEATIELTLRPLHGSRTMVMAIGREIREDAGEPQPASKPAPAEAPQTETAAAHARARTLAAARSLAEASAVARDRRETTESVDEEVLTIPDPETVDPADDDLGVRIIEVG